MKKTKKQYNIRYVGKYDLKQKVKERKVQAINIDDARKVFYDKYGDNYKVVKVKLIRSEVDLNVKEVSMLLVHCRKNDYILLEYDKGKDTLDSSRFSTALLYDTKNHCKVRGDCLGCKWIFYKI